MALRLGYLAPGGGGLCMGGGAKGPLSKPISSQRDGFAPLCPLGRDSDLCGAHRPVVLVRYIRNEHAETMVGCFEILISAATSAKLGFRLVGSVVGK